MKKKELFENKKSKNINKNIKNESKNIVFPKLALNFNQLSILAVKQEDKAEYVFPETRQLDLNNYHKLSNKGSLLDLRFYDDKNFFVAAKSKNLQLVNKDKAKKVRCFSRIKTLESIKKSINIRFTKRLKILRYLLVKVVEEKSNKILKNRIAAFTKMLKSFENNIFLNRYYIGEKRIIRTKKAKEKRKYLSRHGFFINKNEATRNSILAKVDKMLIASERARLRLLINRVCEKYGIEEKKYTSPTFVIRPSLRFININKYFVNTKYNIGSHAIKYRIFGPSKMINLSDFLNLNDKRLLSIGYIFRNKVRNRGFDLGRSILFYKNSLVNLEKGERLILFRRGFLKKAKKFNVIGYLKANTKSLITTTSMPRTWKTKKAFFNKKFRLMLKMKRFNSRRYIRKRKKLLKSIPWLSKLERYFERFILRRNLCKSNFDRIQGGSLRIKSIKKKRIKRLTFTFFMRNRRNKRKVYTAVKERFQEYIEIAMESLKDLLKKRRKKKDLQILKRHIILERKNYIALKALQEENIVLAAEKEKLEVEKRKIEESCKRRLNIKGKKSL